MSILRAIEEAAPTAIPQKKAPARPRLLYLVTRAERGGAQAHVLDLAMGMSERFEVVVGTGEEGFLTDACRELRIPVHVVPDLNREIKPVTDLLSLRVLMQLMRRTRPDIVHAHTFKAGFLGRFAAKHLQIASIYTVHMWPFGRSVPLSWRLTAPACERLAANWCDRVITVSEVGTKLAAEHRICDLSKVISIRNGIPDHPARARLDHDADVRCVMVARFTDFKDHPLLLRAFAQVPGKARLVLVGDGSTLPAATELTAKLGMRDRVEFLGVRSDVPELLAETDVFVLASKQETLPISILEAMRAGLPVIASDVGGVSEEVIDGETGLLVTPGSVEELQAALSKLFSNRTLRKAMGRAGRRRFEKMFLADMMINKTAALYSEVLEERLTT
jgi:glycosyltransferase involved in cell wall biosynthesis